MLARLSLAAGALALAGCAAMNSVTSDVATYGEWPAGRAPGSYAIERLPSQQAHASPMQASIEAGARSALEQAGFKPAADAAQADVMVQIGARTTRTDYVPWDDPLWWRWGPSYWRRPGYYWRPGWAWPPMYESQYDQEVGLLIRDRRTGTPLYEARATNGSRSSPSGDVFAAMFQAALKDFPNAVPSPHRVAVQLGGETAAAK
jgi:hypothetical protein